MIENIIKPHVADALEIANLIKEGWNLAYKGIISDEELKNMNVEEMAKVWENNIKTNENIYIYEENNEILGVVRFGNAEEENEDIGEIFCLYVRPQEKRKGIGTQLFSFAKDNLIKANCNKMIIWCLKGNAQGVNFYKKHGGEKIKERDYIIRGIKLREECYYYNLK